MEEYVTKRDFNELKRLFQQHDSEQRGGLISRANDIFWGRGDGSACTLTGHTFPRDPALSGKEHPALVIDPAYGPEPRLRSAGGHIGRTPEEAARAHAASVPRGPRSVQVFTSSGTWTRPAGVRSVLVEVIGAGGGGGGAVGGITQNGLGAGGGGGGYAAKLVMAPGATVAVTVGVGGAGGAAGNNPGSSGGSSSFGAHAVATGGAGGDGSAGTTGFVAGGAAGIGTSGDVQAKGGFGGDTAISSATLAIGGAGGASHYGGAAQAVLLNSGSHTDGENYGGGGSGGAASGLGSDEAGGAGSDGLVIVYEF